MSHDAAKGNWFGLQGYPGKRAVLKRLIVVRHGQSSWNAAGRLQGQSGEGLSERGHAEARAVAAALAQEYPGAMLVSSDLQRTRETMAPLEAALGRTALLEPRLRERSLGQWEGMSAEELAADDGERWRRIQAGEDVIEEVGGESENAFAERCRSVLRDLLDQVTPGGVTVAVSHGGVIWRGFHALCSLHSGTLGAVENASCNHLVSYHDTDNGAVIARWNERVLRPSEPASAGAL